MLMCTVCGLPLFVGLVFVVRCSLFVVCCLLFVAFVASLISKSYDLKALDPGTACKQEIL